MSDGLQTHYTSSQAEFRGFGSHHPPEILWAAGRWSIGFCTLWQRTTWTRGKYSGLTQRDCDRIFAALKC